MIERAENNGGCGKDAEGRKSPRDLAPARSTPIAEWTIADRAAWERAISPGVRLRKGGAGSNLAAITQNDLARRYGYFVDHLIRKGVFEPDARPAAQVTSDLVAAFIEELRSRVGSVTLAGSIYKLRRAAELLDPDRDFWWLSEIAKDLALMAQPRFKDNRIVDPDRLVEAGLSLIEEATENSALTPLRRARQVRDGLMVALLAFCPIRLKNLAALDLQSSFRRIGVRWWIVLDRKDTKSRRADERRVAQDLDAAIEAYLLVHRPILAATNKGSAIEFQNQWRSIPGAPDAQTRSDDPLAKISGPLWLSSTTGERMGYSAIERAITETTRLTLGVAVNPHLFRSCAATTIYTDAGDNPNLASGVLQHTDRRVTAEHYNRATSVSAALAYAKIVSKLRA